MRLKHIDTCPVWEEDDGSMRPGMDYEPDHPPVVGWCNIATIELDGIEYKLLLNLNA